MARKSFGSLTHFAVDYPSTDGARRPLTCTDDAKCSAHARQADRLSAPNRERFIYAQGARPICAVCLLPGSFALGEHDDARLLISHTVPVALFGSHSPLNLHASHVACNAAAGDRDLRGIVAPVTKAWPSLKATQAFARTPHRRHLGTYGTADDFARARDERILPDGTVGVGF